MHDQQVDQVHAGQRVALNLSGVTRTQVPRGSVAGTSGLFNATQRIDVRLRLLADAPRPLKFRDALHFHLGTGRTVARAVLLDRDEMQPGEELFVQLVLDQPILSHRGDRFIVRSYSPMVTIGGGMVVDSEPHKHKRFRPEVIQRLAELASGDLGFWLQKLDALKVARIKDLEKQTGNSREQLQLGLERLQQAGQVEQLGDQWVPAERVRSWKQRLPQRVAQYHQNSPLQHGIPRATLQAQIEERLAPKGFESLLKWALDEGKIVCHRDLLALPEWKPQPTEAERKILEAIESHFRHEGFLVKNNTEVLIQLGLSGNNAESYLAYLFQDGALVRLNHESTLSADCYNQALTELKSILAEQQQGFTLAEFRDRMGSSRKLVQALLEHFDSLKYTRRVGDLRVAWQFKDAAEWVN